MRSMTGFGRARVSQQDRFVSVEVSTVNNRHLDVHVSIGADLELEQAVKERVEQSLHRGKVDVRVESNVLDRNAESVACDEELVEEYLTLTGELSDQHASIEGTVDVLELLSLPGVLTLRQNPVADEETENMLLEALDEALGDVVRMRKSEGEELRKDLKNRIVAIREKLDRVEERFPTALEHYRERLRERFEEVLTLDEPELTEELEDEITRYADKCDISEEVVRIRSHVDQFLEYLESTEPVGKNLKFLIQELQREINTIGAKGNDAEISQKAVEMKTELEKCREQVNNVE